MFIYPFAQTVTLHYNAKHPIILIDNSKRVWVADLQTRQSKKVEMDDLDDNVTSAIMEAIAADTFTSKVPWIIKLPYSIRYTVKTHQTFNNLNSQRVLAREITTHTLCPCDGNNTQFITTPVIITLVNRSQTHREDLSKTMTLAIGEEIGFVADAITVKVMLVMDTEMQSETMEGNPYVVLENAMDESMFGTLVTDIAERVQTLRYLLDGEKKTQLTLGDLVKVHQPGINSEGYLDFELNLNSGTIHDGFIPRVREVLVAREGKFIPLAIFNELPSEERTKPFYMIVLDTRLSHFKIDELPNNDYRQLLHRYPQLYINSYSSLEDGTLRYFELKEVLNKFPLPEAPELPYTVTTDDMEEAPNVFKVISYLETNYPEVAARLRMNDITSTIQSII